MSRKLLVSLITISCIAFSASAGLVTATRNGEQNLWTLIGLQKEHMYPNQIMTDYFGLAGPNGLGLTGNHSVKILVEFAGYAGQNKFGVYDIVTGNTLEIFPGGASPGASTTFEIGANTVKANGNTLFFSGNFGFYLQNSGGTFYSDPSRNLAYDRYGKVKGIADQMVTYDLIGTKFQAPGFLLAWEDKFFGKGADGDYNDMVVALTPIPEPTTIIAGALLLLPFAASTVRFARKSRK
ncbi:MAG TPA: hypothetical protein VEC99_04615 [Clostridia bacterium]|nr:hypothetical protein [Clostridia bacterium]